MNWKMLKIKKLKLSHLIGLFKVATPGVFRQNTIKDSHRYVVQGSDTTMITRAASSPGQ